MPVWESFLLLNPRFFWTGIGFGSPAVFYCKILKKLGILSIWLSLWDERITLRTSEKLPCFFAYSKVFQVLAALWAMPRHLAFEPVGLECESVLLVYSKSKAAFFIGCSGGLLNRNSEDLSLTDAREFILFSRSQIRQDYPLNLSISISGGKETNQDSPSNGERTGNGPTWKSPFGEL